MESLWSDMPIKRYEKEIAMLHRFFLKWVLLLGLIAFPVAGIEPCVSGAIECQETLTFGLQHFSVYRSYPLKVSNPKIQHLVILVHGINRNANEYFEWAMASAKLAKATETSLVISPHFKNQDDPKMDGELFWDNSLWKFGELSLNENARTSSFAVIDQLLERLVKSNHFPQLKSLVVTGHSAGGQFTNRYALTSKVAESLGLKTSYVVGNPSSYLYLSEERWVADAKRFQKPHTECVKYDEYPYGATKPNPYVSQVSLSEMRNNAQERKLVVFLGALDTESELLDMSCGANLQGIHRRDRGENYFRYLKNILNAKASSLVVVPEIGHDGSKMYRSEEGQRLLFGRNDE